MSRYHEVLFRWISSTTNTPPMTECVPAFVVDVEETSTKMLGKAIKKAIPSMRSMRQVLESLQGQDISEISYESHQWVKIKGISQRH